MYYYDNLFCNEDSCKEKEEINSLKGRGNDKMTRTDICDRQFEELFQNKRTPDKTDPEFMDILQKFIFGEISQIGSLDNKMRELITVVVLTTMQTLPQLKAHVKASLNVGVSPLEIMESIYNCAPFIGFPKTLNAISTMNEVFVESNISLPLEEARTTTEENRFEKGSKIQSPIYGTEIKDKYQVLPKEIGEAIPRFLTELGFGDFYTRKGLSVKTRELLVLCVLTTLGQIGPLKAHVLGNIKVGNSLEVQYAALMQCLPYIGFPSVFAAINMMKEMDINE